MNRRESAIISAYTGVLVGPFEAFHEYVEELLKCPVYVHEIRENEHQIKEKAKADFIALAESISEDNTVREKDYA